MGGRVSLRRSVLRVTWNAEAGNVAADPAWNAAMLAFASRSDMDDGAVALRAPMPGWLASSLTTLVC